MVLVVLFVCLCVCQQDYSQSIDRICIKLLQEVWEISGSRSRIRITIRMGGGILQSLTDCLFHLAR